MAQQKKMVEAITSMNEDFAKWYTDIVKKAELIDYSSVHGCMILRPLPSPLDEQAVFPDFKVFRTEGNVLVEGDVLPDDFICPLCKHGAADFEPIK